MSLGRRARTITTAAVLTLGFGLLATGSAQASHIAGIKVTVKSANPITYGVNVDVTILYANGPATSSQSAYLGNYYRPAIDWGDGDTLPYYQFLYGDPDAVFPGAPGHGIYRGSFSHTYADDGDYTITAYTGSSPVANNADIITGNRSAVTSMYTISSAPYTYSYAFLANTAMPNFSPSSVFGGISSCGLGAELVAILPPLILWRERRRRKSSAHHR